MFTNELFRLEKSLHSTEDILVPFLSKQVMERCAEALYLVFIVIYPIHLSTTCYSTTLYHRTPTLNPSIRHTTPPPT
ncbi:hypothetical protein M3J09_002075 [Ascochyta lentis]